MVQDNYTSRDIAIVGMSCMFPGAQNIDQYWYNLVNGVDSIIEAPSGRIDPMYFQKEEGAYDRFYCNKGGFLDIPAIDPMKYGFLPIAAKGMEPEQLFMLRLVFDALEDAEVHKKNISLENGCVIIGKGNFGNMSSMRNIDIVHTSVQVVEIVKACIPSISNEDLDKIKKAYQKQKGEIKPETIIALMPNLIAALVTNKLNMHGPAYTVDGACASSAIAVNHAGELLLSGQCDIALAAGIHTAQSAMFQASFNMLGAISHKGVISPFSEDADGLLPSEGGGVLVLKTLEKAIADNDRIYALIKASAVYSDGAGVSVMAPNTAGQQLTIAKAWEKVDMDPLRVGLIEAHGTATIAGDKVEINTLNEFFGKDPSLNKIWLGSVKSNIGHTMPAAGMAGIMKAALALFHRRIPPTLHAEHPAKALIDSRFELPQTAIDWEEDKYPLVAGVNAFGFGGINSHVIMTAYDNKPENLIRDNKIVLKRSFKAACLVAAHTKEELLAKIDKAYWMGIEGRYRLIIFDPSDERIEKARSVVEKDKPWKGEMDIWFSNEPLLEKDGKLAFLFPESDTETDAEVNTIADYFELERPGDISNLLNTALKKIKVVPDMNVGHSIGDLNRETKEKARVFVQMGAGSSNGFADNIPQDGKYSVISACNPDRSGLEQLRRVLALLFIEGKEVDALFIRSGETARVIGQEPEPDFTAIVTEIPHIKEVLKKQNKLDFPSCEDSDYSNQPLAQKVSENIREMSLAQKEMLEIMNEVKSLEQKFSPAGSIPQTKEKKVVQKEEKIAQPVQVKKTATAKKTFNEEMIITTKDYPYITDHTVVKQPDHWSVVEDLDVVIPMTMSIEMMMEIAEKHTPDKKVLGLSSFSIYQWMNVSHEFKLKIAGSWISDNLMRLEMKDFITTEIMLGDEYPVPPQKYAGEIDLGKKTHEPPTRHFIYTEIMFHGPNYQGIEKVAEVNECGMRTIVKPCGGKASLLDTMGQVIGTYLRITAKENSVCFPVSVGKITFYRDFHDQSGTFDSTLVVTKINDDFIYGDIIIKRNGNVWCIAENWLNRRFEMNNALWDTINRPLDNWLAKQLEETPVRYFDLAYSKTGSWPFIEKRYLNREEKAHMNGLLLNKRRPYVISRVAIKDAVRIYLMEKYGKKVYPIEIAIDHDEKGKPFAKGLDELEGLEISLSHKGNESVALVSEKPVGVDIELIEERSPAFMDMSFTEGELALLKEREQAEWATRFWTAKEACGKMLGTGLEGNPKKYEIGRIKGDSLFIGRQEIHTVKHKEKYIVAWIIRQT